MLRLQSQITSALTNTEMLEAAISQVILCISVSSGRGCSCGKATLTAHTQSGTSKVHSQVWQIEVNTLCSTAASKLGSPLVFSEEITPHFVS